MVVVGLGSTMASGAKPGNFLEDGWVWMFRSLEHRCWAEAASSGLFHSIGDQDIAIGELQVDREQCGVAMRKRK
jgi:hypothetical protein